MMHDVSYAVQAVMYSFLKSVIENGLFASEAIRAFWLMKLNLYPIVGDVDMNSRPFGG